MRNSKKWMTAVLTAAMVVSQVIPVFASNASITGDGTTSGTANILAYSVDSVVVPTTLKVALNPNAYSLVKEYEVVAKGSAASNGAAALALRNEGTAIFTKAFDTTDQVWKYTAATTDVISDEDIVDNDHKDLTYYKYKFANDQIISLNYGIANKSTTDKVVQIDIKVNQDTNDKAGKEPIVFVDSATKATFGTGDDNAKQNEMKMYLGIASATAAPTAETFERVKEFSTDAVTSGDGKADANTVLYTKDTDGKYKILVAADAATTGTGAPTITDGKVADDANFKKVIASADKKVKVYKESTTIGPEITAVQLSDVSMTKTAVAGGIVPFEAGKENKANASIGFKTVAATYGVETGDTIDAFTTTQEALGKKLQLNALTGTAGFTIVGAMNDHVDWTRADTVALKIQPVYKVSDATGTEGYVDEENNGANPFNQVKLGVAATPSSMSTSARSVTISGLEEGVTLAKVQIVSAADGLVDLGTNLYTYDENVFAIVEAKVSLLLDNTKYTKIVLTYSDDTVVNIPIVAGD